MSSDRENRESAGKLAGISQKEGKFFSIILFLKKNEIRFCRAFFSQGKKT